MGAPEFGITCTRSNGSVDVARGIADDEMEWEYDENETDDFYFTLDVTTHQPEQTSKASQPKKKRKTSRATTSQSKDADAQVVSEPLIVQVPRTQNSEQTRTQSETTTTAKKQGELQILDLHTTNPLIKLNNAFYSCYWSTDLGTQCYVSGQGVIDQPLRTGYVVDVVGMSRARLTAMPVTLHRRKNAIAKQVVGASPGNAINIEDGGVAADISNDVLIRENQSPPSSRTSLFAAAREKTRDPALKAQASFLERLTAIKERKGETDIVPLHGVKNYRAPHKKDEPHERTLSVITTRENNESNSTGKPRKRGISDR